MIPEYHTLYTNFFIKIISVLNNTKTDYLPIAGTLLGLVRDNKILPWDFDLDIILPSEQATKELFHVIEEACKEFSPHYDWNKTIVKTATKFQKIYNAPEICIVKFIGTGLTNQVPLRLDFLVHWKFKDKLCKTVTGIKDISMLEPTYLAPAKYIKFHGNDVRIPVNAEQLLEFQYGENWQTPMPEWDAPYDFKVEKI